MTNTGTISTDVESDLDNVTILIRDDYEERSAMLEHRDGLKKDYAEKQAASEMIEKIRNNSHIRGILGDSFVEYMAKVFNRRDSDRSV